MGGKTFSPGEILNLEVVCLGFLANNKIFFPKFFFSIWGAYFSGNSLIFNPLLRGTNGRGAGKASNFRGIGEKNSTKSLNKKNPKVASQFWGTPNFSNWGLFGMGLGERAEKKLFPFPKFKPFKWSGTLLLKPKK